MIVKLGIGAEGVKLSAGGALPLRDWVKLGRMGKEEVDAVALALLVGWVKLLKEQGLETGLDDGSEGTLKVLKTEDVGYGDTIGGARDNSAGGPRERPFGATGCC